MKWRYRLGAVAGNALEYYDIAVFAAISVYLSAELEKQGYESATEMVWGIFALRFLTRPVGGYIIGRYADKRGKRSALILTSLITGTATLCMALLPIHILGGYTPVAILVLQMVISFSFAGENPALVTYLFSTAKENEHSRLSGLIVGSSVLGVIASLGLVLLLEKILDPVAMQTFGWRIPLFLGVINILMSFWFRSRLPTLPVSPEWKKRINVRQTIIIFFMTVPGSAVFYSCNMSSSLMRTHIQAEALQEIYGILSSGLYLFCMFICSWLTDKYSSAERVFKIGVSGVVLLSIPLYFLLSSQSVWLVILAQLILTMNASMLSCTLSSVSACIVRGHTTTLSVGYNVSSTVIGGLTPLIIGYLVGFNLTYAGVYIAASGLTVVLSYKLMRTNRIKGYTPQTE
ncbi:MFS transporter [Morganella psychrotolerans]|uniref:MFS transporter n=1 Tax=Morganella psychrotolerans TaxID=368603 RepID=A0A1B8HQW9_9GAMM|nr:MFS transporter [Morganella psychrotolerans]OBU11834.1 MFS transporter [Morganella psychrotolerans]